MMYTVIEIIALVIKKWVFYKIIKLIKLYQKHHAYYLNNCKEILKESVFNKY